MRITTLLIFLTLYLNAFTQDAADVKQIDRLVTAIDSSNFTVQKDSIIQDMPALGLYIKTYLTMIVSGSEIKKYAQVAQGSSNENGRTIERYANTAFYFDHNKLIKVVESGSDDGKKIHGTYYFSSGKVLFFEPKTEKQESRANDLLVLSDVLLKKFMKQ